MKVFLKNITLKNFKGVRSLEASPSANCLVYGRNGVGKSTIKNAFLWVLTGRDQQGRTDHEIRPRDEDKNITHNLDSTVEVVLDIDGNESTLKRLYKEKWSRKTGDEAKTYDGNTTEYYLNSVKVTKKEYDAFTSSLLNLELLSDESYFLNLDWKKQRDLLLELVDIKDKDIEALDERLLGFTDTFDVRLLDSIKLDKKRKRGELEKDKARYDSQLEENLNNKQEELDWEQIDKSINEKKKRIEEIDSLIENASKATNEKEESQSNELLEKASTALKALNAEKSKLLEQEEAFKNKCNATSNKLEKELSDSKELLITARSKNANLEVKRLQLTNEIESLNVKKKNKLAEYHNLNNTKFSVDEICPTCGGVRADLALFSSNAEEVFNKEKSNDLKLIINAGKIIADSIENAQKELDSLIEVDTEDIAKSITAQEAFLKGLKFEEPKELATLRDSIANLQAGYDKIKAEIDKPKESVVKESNPLVEERAEKELLNSEIESLSEKKGLKLVAESQKKRIEELKKQIKESSLKQTEYDRDIFIIELFEKVKNKHLEKLITSKFEITEFELFEYLNDGTAKPNCQAFYKGVPASSLNTGAKILVGLDIIKTFSQHLGIQYPIFIDNRESLTDHINTGHQTISLVAKVGSELEIINK